MAKIIFGLFIVLHGLVHLLYFGQSRRLFEMRPGMVWPDGSWAFSRLFGDETVRLLASLACIIAAIGFIAGGVGILIGQSWSIPLVVGSAAFSSALYILFWDGKMQRLDDKGGIGLLINLAILILLLILQRPDLGF